MLDKKIDKIQEDITEIKVIMAENTTSLKEHMRRTNLLEERLAPVERHVNRIEGISKFLALLAAILAAVGTILTLKH